MPYVGRELTRGSYIKLDDIQSQFNGSKTTFNLTSGGSAFYPGSATSVLVSVGGTVQEPVTEYGIDHNQIVFTTAPTSSQNFFCVALGVALGVGVPARGSTGGSQLAKPLNYDNGLLYLDDVANEVGINTITPGKVLDVYGGDARFNGGLIGNVHNTTGISTFNDVTISGNLTVQGDQTTLNTTLRNVELLRVAANSSTAAGIITQTGTGDILNLFDATTEVMTVVDGGRVGIGVTNPSTKLHINESSASPCDVRISNSEGYGFIRSDSNLLAYNAEQHLVANRDRSTEYLRITNAGRIGIGTIVPQTIVHIADNVPVIRLTDKNASGGPDSEFSGAGGNIDISSDINDEKDDSVIRFNIDGTERMRIEPTMIGIGTVNPAKQVHIEAAEPFLRLENTHTGSKRLDLRVEDSDNHGYISSPQSGQHLKLYGRSAFTIATDSETDERFRITSGGDVGVGNDSPNCRLAVKDTTAALTAYANATPSVGDCMAQLYYNPSSESNADHATLQFGVNGGSNNRVNTISSVVESAGNRKMAFTFCTDDAGSRTEKFRITGDGSVGIGITNPGRDLHVKSTTPYIRVESGAANQPATLELFHTRGNGSDKWPVSVATDDAALTFNLATAANGAPAEKVRITSAGKTFIHATDATGANDTATLLSNGNTLNIHGTSSSDGISVVRYSANYGAYGINIGKSRNNTFGTNTLVQDGNELGHISFYGADGTDFNMAAQITGLVDGDPATGGDATDMPGALSLRTTPEGSDTPLNRLYIAADGKVGIGTDNLSRKLQITGNGLQQILVGSLDNQGASLMLDGIGNGDGSGGNYSSFDVGTDGHLKIKNYDADKNIILGTGSQVGGNDTLIIDSDQMVTIATRNSSNGGELGFKFGSFGIRSQDSGGYNYWHIDRNYGGWQSSMISLKADGKVGINQAVPTYQLHVNGSFAATTKSFVIDHPTKENYQLRYACLEGPENSVYVRGRSSDPVIELPDYWVGLVHEDSITVNVTPIGNKKVWVESINNNSVTIGSDDSTEYFYTVFAERKDVEKLEVEVEN